MDYDETLQCFHHSLGPRCPGEPKPFPPRRLVVRREDGCQEHVGSHSNVAAPELMVPATPRIIIIYHYYTSFLSVIVLSCYGC